LDSVALGMYLDFDIPENDNTSNPYNDHVLADPIEKVIYLANNGDWENGPVPAVIMLSEEELRYRVIGSLPGPLSDGDKWDIMKIEDFSQTLDMFEETLDYRFIIFSTIHGLSPGEEKTFSFALVHSQGYGNSHEVISELRDWWT